MHSTAPAAPLQASTLAAPCPCGLPAPLAGCCARWWQGPLWQQAPDAPSLMRSRYSAFVALQAPYLLATWHASTRPEALTLDPGLRWLGLTLKQWAQQDDDHATVQFVARSKLGGRAHRLQETSRFVREGGRWFYVDGDLDSAPPEPPGAQKLRR